MKFDSLDSLPITFPMADGRSAGPNNPLTRLRGFTVGGIWESRGKVLEP